jgi:hypothetical protein
MAARNGDLASMQVLLKHGANAHAVDSSGMNALHYAVSSTAPEAKKVKTVRFLIRQGVDVAAIDDRKNTVLHTAARSGANRETLAALLSPRLDINARNAYGMTALHEAASDKNFAGAAFLLERGADVNAQDKWGQTPLHRVLSEARVVHNKHLDSPHKVEAVMRLLVISGKADVSIKDKDGKTAIDIAREYLEEAKKELDNTLWKKPNIEMATKLVEYLEDAARVQGRAAVPSPVPVPAAGAFPSDVTISTTPTRAGVATAVEAVESLRNDRQLTDIISSVGKGVEVALGETGLMHRPVVGGAGIPEPTMPLGSRKSWQL